VAGSFEGVLAIDHVIVLVRDLDEAADWMWDDHGLASIEGGRHRGHGTGNRIVPLGDAYIELMAVVDAGDAMKSPMGRWVAAHTVDRPSPAALCLRTGDAGEIAARLGLDPLPMSRTLPDGSTLSWRLVGVDEAFGDDRLPFFIEWHAAPEDHPGRAAASHRVEPTGAVAVELGGDPSLVLGRLGDHGLPIMIVDGPPGISRVAVETLQGDVVLSGHPPGTG
jgi:hypothetical protein